MVPLLQEESASGWRSVTCFGGGLNMLVAKVNRYYLARSAQQVAEVTDAD